MFLPSPRYILASIIVTGPSQLVCKGVLPYQTHTVLQALARNKNTYLQGNQLACARNPTESGRVKIYTCANNHYSGRAPATIEQMINAGSEQQAVLAIYPRQADIFEARQTVPIPGKTCERTPSRKPEESGALIHAGAPGTQNYLNDTDIRTICPPH